MWVAFANSHFFSKNISKYAIFNDLWEVTKLGKKETQSQILL